MQPTIVKNFMWSEQTPRLSIVMIGHRRVDLLDRAISSLRRYAPVEGWEFVLVQNGDSPALDAYAMDLRSRAGFPLAVVRIPESLPGAARNFGARVTRSPVLLFLDDDIECFQDVVSAAIDLFKDPVLAAAGGANLTPPDSGALARATGGVMSTWLGTASMSRRYRLIREGVADEHSLMLCNLAVRRPAFQAEQGFAIHLVSNEENVLLQRLSLKRAKLWSSPRLAVFHYRRETWGSLCSQAAKYGAGRAQNLRLVPESFRVLYLLPCLLVVYTIVFPLLAGILGGWAAAPLLTYLGLVLVCAFVLAARHRDPAHLLSIVVFPCVHFSYGAGFASATWRGFRARGRARWPRIFSRERTV